MKKNIRKDGGSERQSTGRLAMPTEQAVEGQRQNPSNQSKDSPASKSTVSDREKEQQVIALQADLAERDQHIQALDEELKQAWAAVVQLNRRWTDVEPSLQERQREVATLRDQLAEGHALQARLQDEINDRQSRIASLEKALADGQREAATPQTKQASADAAAGDRGGQQEKLAALEHYIENRRQRWDEMENTLRAHQDRGRELEHELLERVKRVEELENRTRLAEAEIATLKQRLIEADLASKTSREAAATAEGRMATLDAEILEWREHTAKLRSELNKLQPRGAAAEGAAEDRTRHAGAKDPVQLDSRVQIAELARSTAEARAAALQEELELLKAQPEAADSEFQQALRERDEQLAQLGARAKHAEQARGAAEAQAAALREELQLLRRRLEAADAAGETEQVVKATAGSEQHEQAAGIAALKAEVERLQSAEAKRAKALKSAEAKIGMLAEALADQEAELVKTRGDAQASVEALREHEQVAAEAAPHSDLQVQRLSALTLQLRASEEAAGTARAELAEARRRFEQMRGSVEAFTGDIGELEIGRERREQLLEKLQRLLQAQDVQIATSGQPGARPSAIENSSQELGSRTSPHGRPVLEDDGTPMQMLVSVGEGREIRYPICKDVFTIGRTAESDIQIAASHISRRHAQIIRDLDDTYIEDLSSTNGVYVNAHRITRQKLQHGDEVMIGELSFRYLTKRTQDVPEKNRVPDE